TLPLRTTRAPDICTFPYTTLFRSDVARRMARVEVAFHVVATALGLVALWLVPGGRLKLLVVALLLFHWAVYVVANATNRFRVPRSEEHTSELQSRENLVCRLLLEK